jgi:hypothetical protein
MGDVTPYGRPNESDHFLPVWSGPKLAPMPMQPNPIAETSKLLFQVCASALLNLRSDQ